MRKATDALLESNLKVAEEIAELYEEMKIIFREKLSSKWYINALDFIFAHPVFMNSKFTSESGIPSPTAARFTRILSEGGLLVTLEEPSGNRSAVYKFEELLRLIRV